MRVLLILILIAATLAEQNRNFYKILGVEKKASQKEIKSAYRKLSLEWHPDKNPEKREEALAKYQEINDAYEALGDPDKRRKYDRGGESALNKPQQSDVFDIFG